MFLQVQTTTESEDEARRIATELVQRRLAGCVQVLGPITSVYRWQGQMESAREWLCLIKTTQAAYQQVEATVRELHSYETPQVIALPITQGSEAYLSWLGGAVGQ